MVLFIDFETKDPYINLGYGAGWVFALRKYQIPEFRILGASIATDFRNGNDIRYITDLSALRNIIRTAKEICMHNAQYDVGCILALFNEVGETWDIKDVMIYDTMLMAKLVDQHKLRYSLEALSKSGGGAQKDKTTLSDYAWESGLYQQYYKTTTGRNKYTRPSEAVINEFCMSNLDLFPTDVVGQYCNDDVLATKDLFIKYKGALDRFPKEFNYDIYSTLVKICVQMRIQGMRVDTDQARKTRDILESKAAQLEKELYESVGYEFNINAPLQVIDALKALGMTSFSKTTKGNPSADKAWLEEQGHPDCKRILKIKNYQKLARDFLTKIIEYQQIHRQNGVNESRVFCNLNILGATKTGRFSSSGTRVGKKGYELNIQQIPKRGDDDEASRYVREVFLADEDEQWVSADYSNQEQRLQVHYANILNLAGSHSIKQILISDPEVDFHGTVADICRISRTDAKTINLGLAYGMGGAKLCHSLGLPTRMQQLKSGKIVEVPDLEGEDLLAQYHAFLPFMKQLQDYCKSTLLQYGYIKTIGGRKLTIDPPMKIDDEWVTFERKGLSKLVQGSAADVTTKALINCYNAGLKIVSTVHDEINISTKNEKDVETLRTCMMNTFDICVPMIVDISKGDTWAG